MAAGPTRQDQIDRVVGEARAGDVRLTRVMWCGNDGLIRAKAVTTDHLGSRLSSGLGLSSAQPAQTARDRIVPEGGRGPIGEMRLTPDPETFRVLPFAPATAAMIGDLRRLDGTPDPTCPRAFLRRVLASADERGLAPIVGFENEFTLARETPDGWEPIDSSPCFSTAGALASQDAMELLLGALGALHVDVEGCHAEGGSGQNEIAIAPSSALEAVDEQIFVREAIRAVAAAVGLVASVSPKPFATGAGNGLHVHISLAGTDGGNAFSDPERNRLSPIGRAFVAGLLEHLPALVGVTAPSPVSHRRLTPEAWAGAWRCWGDDNREAAVRACSAFARRERESLNLEYKPSDASASPYLTVGSILAAGLDGVDRELVPAAPVQVDPARLSDADRAARGIERLPETPSDALDALERDDVLLDAMGDELARTFVAVRRSEWESSLKADEDRVVEDHFLRY